LYTFQKNKMNKIITIAIAICFFTSCANKEPEQDTSLYVKDTVKAVEPISSPAQNILSTDTAVSQLPGQATVTQMPAQAVSQATATTAPGMNPPHGQPGHRCDISVGAPLNSAPTKPATTTTAPVVTQTSTPATTAKTVTAPGMNPPHGEPGHRCDISVGAPLNSAPAKPATQAASPVTTPVTIPVEHPKRDSLN
jgi:hypothetical protein